jgi:regulatory protein
VVAGRRRPDPAARRAERAEVEDPQVVLDAALRFLETRSRSVAEVRRRLIGAGYRHALVEAAIERLLGLRLLEDEAFARAWVASRDRAHPRGEIALRRELALKGIARETIAAVLDGRRSAAIQGDVREGAGPDDAAAASLLAKHARALGRIADPRRRRQRAYALLARHGFDPATAGREAARAGAELDAEDDGGVGEGRDADNPPFAD